MPLATMEAPTETPRSGRTVPSPAAAAESQRWLDRLSSTGSERERAVAELRVLLLRAARFELARRPGIGAEREDLAQQSANDALLAVLGKLGEFRGESRFTTWAYKFALLEAGVKSRRRAWHGREVPLHDTTGSLLIDARASAHAPAEAADLLAALQDEIDGCLSERQRVVLIAVTLNGVPIDVLAERLGSTRGALYKTLHDARRKLRAALAERGFELDLNGWEEP